MQQPPYRELAVLEFSVDPVHAFAKLGADCTVAVKAPVTLAKGKTYRVEVEANTVTTAAGKPIPHSTAATPSMVRPVPQM